MEEPVRIESKCHSCALRARAEKKPRSLIGIFWRWHTRWCPGWKAYVRELTGKGLEVPKIPGS